MGMVNCRLIGPTPRLMPAPRASDSVARTCSSVACQLQHLARAAKLMQDFLSSTALTLHTSQWLRVSPAHQQDEHRASPCPQLADSSSHSRSTRRGEDVCVCVCHNLLHLQRDISASLDPLQLPDQLVRALLPVPGCRPQCLCTGRPVRGRGTREACQKGESCRDSAKLHG